VAQAVEAECAAQVVVVVGAWAVAVEAAWAPVAGWEPEVEWARVVGWAAQVEAAGWKAVVVREVAEVVAGWAVEGSKLLA
jgi:hypothetical protein